MIFFFFQISFFLIYHIPTTVSPPSIPSTNSSCFSSKKNNRQALQHYPRSIEYDLMRHNMIGHKPPQHGLKQLPSRRKRVPRTRKRFRDTHPIPSPKKASLHTGYMHRIYFRSTQVVASVSASLHKPCLFHYVGCIFVVSSLSLGS